MPIWKVSERLILTVDYRRVGQRFMTFTITIRIMTFNSFPDIVLLYDVGRGVLMGMYIQNVLEDLELTCKTTFKLNQITRDICQKTCYFWSITNLTKEFFYKLCKEVGTNVWCMTKTKKSCQWERCLFLNNFEL